MTEAAKSLVAYFEVLHVGFVKKPCDANLVFCSCVLDARTKTCEKTEAGLLIKMNKQLNNKIRSENLTIFNFAKIGKVCAS